LLGNIVSHEGIRPNPEKVKAVMKMKPPKCIKDIQKLTMCMAALSRFILWLDEKGLPFFKLLKAKEKFEWSEEANTAFTELKQFLTSSILTAPKKGETLLLYIVATNRVVSTAIVVEREEVGPVYKV
jgi:hypothetical protein